MNDYGYSIVPNKPSYGEHEIQWGYKSKELAIRQAEDRLLVMGQEAYAKLWVRNTREQCGIITDRRSIYDE